MSTYAWGVLLGSFLIAINAYHLILGERLTKQELGFHAGFLVGSGILAIGGICIWLLFRESSGWIIYLGRILNAAMFLVAYLLGKEVRQKVDAKILDRQD